MAQSCSAKILAEPALMSRRSRYASCITGLPFQEEIQQRSIYYQPTQKRAQVC